MRDEIKKLFDQEHYHGEYKKMKDTCGLPPYVDLWFEGCIRSLFYRPNKAALILVGPQNIGKTTFLKKLLPDKKLHLEVMSLYTKSDLYKYFTIDFPFSERTLSYPSKHNFQCINTGVGEVDVDKRLVSYACTTNDWKFNKRKNFIVVNCTDKLKLINEIDTSMMWRELYAMYRVSGKMV